MYIYRNIVLIGMYSLKGWKKWWGGGEGERYWLDIKPTYLPLLQ